MSKINFYKMSGCGNDFIIIDNRDRIVDETNLRDFIAGVCRRKMSAGADGLILVENSDKADFRWRFFNSDGSNAEMCGNGARCVSRFACVSGIAGPELSFETEAGIISARIISDRVKIRMTDPENMRTDDRIELKNGPLRVSRINTGVPHAIVEVDNIENTDVQRLGREIRFHKAFAPAGTNVNFVCPREDGGISNRTYERGVEDETLACGTGCVGAALVMAHKAGMKSPVSVITKSGGSLIIHYEKKNGRFCNIYLEGDARIIYKGELWEEAWH